MKNSKFVALGLSVVLALGLVACGSQTQEPKENQQGGSVTTSPAPEESAPSFGDGVTDDFLKTITAETAEAQGLCGANLNWYYKDNVLAVKGTGAITEYNKDEEVPWNDYRDKINRVIIDEGCTALSDELFYRYSNLSSVFLPDSLTEMGESAFEECAELVYVQLGNGITSTGLTTFFGCEKLETIELPNSLTIIGDHSFSGCESLKNINIPDGVTKIGDGAFSRCGSLTSINIPESVTIIDAYVFSGCDSLKSITIPENVTAIGDGVFEYCSTLSTLTIPQNVTELGADVFYKCNDLKSVDIKTPDYIIENGILFNKEKTIILGSLISDINTYSVPDGVVEIAGYALRNLNSLRTVTFPASLKKIGNRFMETRFEEDTQFTFTFLGDAPEGFSEYIAENFDDNPMFGKTDCTIYYYGNGFEEALIDAEYQGYQGSIKWVKQ